MKKCYTSLLWLSLALALLPAAIFFRNSSVAAAPIPDTTVGTQVNSAIPNLFLIDGGTTAGQNLFHSFESFNIDPSETVFFISVPDIANIFSRVTGGSPSEINGLLGTFGSDADLFLLNPSGIVFGPRASLNLQGSFIATTADAVEFGDGGTFSALIPGSEQLLTVNPSAFLFRGTQPTGDIVNRARTLAPLGSPNSGLQVPAGESLVLLGGNVLFEDAQLTVFGTRTEIGAIATSGQVGFSPDTYALAIPSTVDKADIDLNNSAIASITTTGNENFAIYADNLTLSNASIASAIVTALVATTSEQVGDINITTNDLVLLGTSQLGSIVFGQGNAGDILIDSRNTVVLDGLSDSPGAPSLINTISPGAIGNSGNITISTGTLQVVNGASIVSSNAGTGNTGDININATEKVTIGGTKTDETLSLLISAVQATGVGNSGNITIAGGALELVNGANLGATSFGVGDAGNLILNIRDDVVIDGKSDQRAVILTSSFSEAGGDSGNIEINAGNLNLLGKTASISSGALATGDAGDIILNIEGNISVDGIDNPNGIISAVGPEAIGTGGNITVVANSLSLRNGGGIGAGTLGLGNAGDVSINAQESVVLDGGTDDAVFEFQGNVFFDGTDIASSGSSSITSSVGMDATGNGGEVKVVTNSLTVTNGAQLATSTFGQGNAGNIRLEIQDQAIFDGTSADQTEPSAVFSTVRENAIGDGGDIEVMANTLTISNGAELNTGTAGAGDAGDIRIRAAEQVRLDNGELSVISRSNNQAGNIDVITNRLELVNASLINAESDAVDGGNISLTLDDILLLRTNSQITATGGTAASGGNGGNINIVAPLIVAIPTEDSDITANAFTGSGGQVNITAQGIFGIESRPRPTPLSDITASSEQGISGAVNLTTLDTGFIQNNLTDLPTLFVNTDTLIATSCVASAQADGALTLTGSSDLAEAPTGRFGSAYSTGGVEIMPPSVGSQSNDSIQEPAGIFQLADGRLIMSQECS
ncbi:two-partner secretion domain-containing protein [Leptothoe kymatousa]|uniref:Filamentous hemagglutinin N-terminal domain-containing protein n=1 Tax=Leptothoe kymatousa TAU-MAC 1615 TaxID=2364775 RepID=A0ABS5Y499_9CYAN|nr:filamentous hemagglutinin N-terminal domain-containing protein [Leptothoe kymatousa]MBT9312650.1 filamentous hemagglutinin N-terminal domain-containing protein [Leptothoe kymatousa TAU-MAC 1615]